MNLKDMPAPQHQDILDIAPQPRLARVLLAILERLQVGQLNLITPDGRLHAFTGPDPGPQAMLRIHDWRVCTDVLRAGDIGFAESYIQKRWDTPDLARLLAVVAVNHSALESAIYGRWWGSIAYRLRHLLRGNSRGQARRNVHAHYDLGNAFYALWLDATMTYSSGMFEGRMDSSLEEAQSLKYERILENLGVRAGDRVLEIGCGWGGFAEHAARTRACRVHGITLSKEQLAFARARVDQAGLGQLVTFELRDYRDVRGEYDHVVSIEMFEAVGEKYWPQYFRTVRDRLKKGGRALVQTISIADRLFARYRTGTDFIQQYVFPGGMLPSEEIFRDRASQQGLVVGGSLKFRLDYAETVRRWRQRFNARLTELHALGFDERFVRTWNFYLAYCEAGFRAGTIDVLQVELKRV
jgi:cyclopropane-fatty-acyl-phospholipid synthase